MTTYKNLVVMAIAMLCLLQAPVRAADWNLVFDDEFNGTQLDRSTWGTRFVYQNETLDHVNDEAERYRDNDNQVVKDGVLNLVARKVGNGWESGMIRSQQTFYYGYYEARVKLPKGKGISAAFWLNSDYDINGGLSWPPEVDIFEYVVNGVQDTENMVHSAGSRYPQSVAANFSYSAPSFNLHLNDYISDKPLNSDWHVFGFLWLPNEYTVYLDGVKVYTRDFQWVNHNGAPAPPAHILLNFALGGQWAGRYGIDESNFPQALSVDYVRVCQFSDHGGSASRCPRGPYTPDLSGISYSAPGDMKKPGIGATAINGASAQPASAPVSIGAGQSLKVDTAISNLTSVPDNRSLWVALKKPDANPVAVASVVIPKAAYAADASSSVTVESQIPSDFAAGDYEVVLGLAPTVQGPKARPLFTPISCAGSYSTLPKTRFCPVGRVHLASAGK